MKKVKEILYERFKDESDPVRDLNIGDPISDEDFDKLQLETIELLQQFMKKYDELTHFISPSSWRVSGTDFTALRDMENNLDKYQKITREEFKNAEKYMNEKFDETSDSIRDMHIGGIDLAQMWNETVNAGITSWYKRLHDLDLLGKKTTFTDRDTQKEITMVIKEIKRGRMPNEIFLYSDKKIRHQLDIKQKLYIHE
jgi:hypothetical protein